MSEGEDWVMRPVLEGCCKYESLLDCTLDLEDITRMNEAIDVKYENQHRYRKANE
jgi:hypothetical protein